MPFSPLSSCLSPARRGAGLLTLSFEGLRPMSSQSPDLASPSRLSPARRGTIHRARSPAGRSCRFLGFSCPCRGRLFILGNREGLRRAALPSLRLLAASFLCHPACPPLPSFVIPSGATRFSLPRRILARRVAESRDLSVSVFLLRCCTCDISVAPNKGTVGVLTVNR